MNQETYCSTIIQHVLSPVQSICLLNLHLIFTINESELKANGKNTLKTLLTCAHEAMTHWKDTMGMPAAKHCIYLAVRQ